jgi:hypothetical protein
MNVRKLISITVIVLSVFSQDHTAKAKQPSKQLATDERGTEKSPLIVKQTVIPKTDEEIKREEEERKEKSENDRDIVQLTAALAAIALGQLAIYAYQAHKLRQTVKSAGEQSEAMNRHIGEAARSANAMEKIAETIQEGNREIMRAYLSVVIGSAVYQERQEGKKFEGKPLDC